MSAGRPPNAWTRCGAAAGAVLSAAIAVLTSGPAAAAAPPAAGTSLAPPATRTRPGGDLGWTGAVVACSAGPDVPKNRMLVSVRVVDHPSGYPIPGALVRVKGRKYDADVNGRASIATRPGRVTVEASLMGFETTRTSFEAGVGCRADVVLRMPVAIAPDCVPLPSGICL